MNYLTYEHALSIAEDCGISDEFTKLGLQLAVDQCNKDEAVKQCDSALEQFRALCLNII
jgi:hypothetical protein